MTGATSSRVAGKAVRASRVRLLDSITDLRPTDAGAVVVSGSHGGLYPAALACRGRLRGVIFNDAGIGFQKAGIAGVAAAAEDGLAAAAADCMSCRIGSAADMIENGVISAVNSLAAACGVTAGMKAAEAAGRLSAAAPSRGKMRAPDEARRVVRLERGVEALLVDSASLVGPADAGVIIITGSHGGLIGGDPARALKARARLAVFNDAGLGKGGVGVERLPALQARGVAAATVGHDSARIGDAASALESGIVSAANDAAVALGLTPGARLADALGGLG